MDTKYLCPQCDAEVVEDCAADETRSRGGIIVKCTQCEYTAPDYHFCNPV